MVNFSLVSITVYYTEYKMQCFIYALFLELLLLYDICSNFQIIKKKKFKKNKQPKLLLCELFVTCNINNLFIFSLVLIKETTDEFPRPCEVVIPCFRLKRAS